MPFEYKLEGAPFAQGHASKIFRAKGPDGATVAVKVFELPSSEAKVLKEAVDAINAEFVTRASVGEHPCLLSSIEVQWPTPSTAHIVMGYAGGGSAQQRLSAACAAANEGGGRGGGGGAGAITPATLFKPQEVVSVAYNLTSVLAHLHSCNTIHLDVKPANTLFLDDKCTPPKASSAVLSDFGTARVVKVLSKSTTMSRMGVGTENFMAPEVLFKDSKGTDKADVWSLGATLLALLTGFEIGDEDSGPRDEWKAAGRKQLSDWDRGAFFAPGAETLPVSARAPWTAAPLELREYIISCFVLVPEGRPTTQVLLEMPIMKREAEVVEKERERERMEWEVRGPLLARIAELEEVAVQQERKITELETKLGKIEGSNMSLKQELVALKEENTSLEERIKIWSFVMPLYKEDPNFGPVIEGTLAEWRAANPRALVANISGRNDLVDADFVYLQGIKALNMESCGQSTITDAAFVHLKGIHTLHMGWCDQPTITDAAFVHLKGIHTLDIGYCNRVIITDAAFVHLKGVHTLKTYGCR